MNISALKTIGAIILVIATFAAAIIVICKAKAHLREKPGRFPLMILLFLVSLGISFASLGGAYVESPAYGWLLSPVLFFAQFDIGLSSPVLVLYFALLSYFLSWVFLTLYQKSKTGLIVTVLLFLLLFGVDEIFINSTINRPNDNCKSSDDCELKLPSRDGCSPYQCVNKTWLYYDSLISDAFAYSCTAFLSPGTTCQCRENKCVIEPNTKNNQS